MIKLDETNGDAAVDVDRAFNFNRYHYSYNPSELEKYDFKRGRITNRENTVKKSLIKGKNFAYFQSMSSYL